VTTRVVESQLELTSRWLEVGAVLDSHQHVEMEEVEDHFEDFVEVVHGEEEEDEEEVAVVRHLLTLPLNAKTTELSLQSDLRG
jgi:hypothetical protein